MDAEGGELIFAKAREGPGRRLAACSRPAEAERCRPARLASTRTGRSSRRRTSSTSRRRAAPGDEHDLLRREAPERVLDRLHRVGVADLAAGVEVGRGKAAERDGQTALGVQARLAQVRQPVGERRVSAGARTRTSASARRSGAASISLPSAAISRDRAGEARDHRPRRVVTTTSSVSGPPGESATSIGSSNVRPGGDHEDRCARRARRRRARHRARRTRRRRRSAARWRRRSAAKPRASAGSARASSPRSP